MGESKRGLTPKEAHELVDERMVKAMTEAGTLLGIVIPDVLRSMTADDRDRRAAVDRLQKLCDHFDGRGLLAAAALGRAIHLALSSEPPIQLPAPGPRL